MAQGAANNSNRITIMRTVNHLCSLNLSYCCLIDSTDCFDCQFVRSCECGSDILFCIVIETYTLLPIRYASIQLVYIYSIEIILQKIVLLI